MSENIVVILNMCLYLLVSIFLAIQKGKYSLVSIISYFYSFGAIFSYLLYLNPLYSITYTANGVASIEACLYLFTINFLLITSFYKVNLDDVRYLIGYNEKLFRNLQKLLCILFTVYLIFSFPNSVAKFFSGADLSDMRNEIYGANTSSNFFLISLINRFFGSVPIVLLTITSINVFLLKKNTILDKWGLVLYILLKINTIFAAISRQTMIFSFLEFIIIFFLFRNYFSKKIKKYILKYLMIVIPVMYSIFAMISYSRFGAQGMANAQLVNVRYAGEANLNFMNLMYGNIKEPFWGYSQFPIFRRFMGLDYDDGTTREGNTVFNSYIQQHYHYYNPTYIFHGLAGNFYSNYGWWGCLFLAAIINILVRRNSGHKTKISCMQIIIVVVMGAYIAKGIFYGDYAFESGNLLLVYLVMLALYLSKNGYAITINRNNVI